MKHLKYAPFIKINKTGIVVLLLVLFFSGCGTLVQKSGEILEGGAFDEKTVSIFRGEKPSGFKAELREVLVKNKEDGIREGAFLVFPSAYPGLVIRLSLPTPEGAVEFVSAEILSSHLSGWNEFSLDLIGSAFFVTTDDSLILNIPVPAERVQVSSGKIRLKSRRLSGSDALRNLRNRRERILALVDWMTEQKNAENGEKPPDFENRDAFENFWKKYLFPELESKKRRPGNYSEENAEWVRADGIKWNKTYTASIFPEWMRELRNSGALYRDWEEALTWIYYEYDWDVILAGLSGIELKKIK